MKKIAVYGSLREGEYNFNRFKDWFPSIKVIGQERVSGFVLFSLGSYPGIRFTGNPEDSVVFDFLEVPDECYTQITLMEIGANYKVITLNTNMSDKIVCYEYLGNSERLPIIEHGDWSRYLKEHFVNDQSVITT